MGDGFAAPVRRDFQAEEVGDGGGGVVLDDGLVDVVVFADAFAEDDEGAFHFFDGEAAVAAVDAAMVSGHDYDRILPKTCLLESFNNLTDALVKPFLACHVFFSVPAFYVACFILDAIVEEE